MLPEIVTLPTRFFLQPDQVGCHVTHANAPQLLALDVARPVIHVSGAPGTPLQRLPAAEGSLELLKAGVPPREPTTFALTIFDLSNGQRVFVCTELAENAGMSVTNAWPRLAEAILQATGAGPGDARKHVFLEHYFPGSYSNGQREESFDRVDIVWRDGRAVDNGWRPLPPLPGTLSSGAARHSPR